jgi:hypothetical protein
VLVLLIEGNYYVRHPGVLGWDDIFTKFRDDRSRHLGNFKVSLQQFERL